VSEANWWRAVRKLVHPARATAQSDHALVGGRGAATVPRVRRLRRFWPTAAAGHSDVGSGLGTVGKRLAHWLATRTRASSTVCGRLPDPHWCLPQWASSTSAKTSEHSPTAYASNGPAWSMRPIADYHVLTVRDTADRLLDHVLDLVADYLAAGIVPTTATTSADEVPCFGQGARQNSGCVAGLKVLLDAQSNLRASMGVSSETSSSERPLPKTRSGWRFGSQGGCRQCLTPEPVRDLRALLSHQ
jgi:hypothetical protein